MGSTLNCVVVVDKDLVSGSVPAESTGNLVRGAGNSQTREFIDHQALQAPAHKADLRDPPQEDGDTIKVGKEAREKTVDQGTGNTVRW